jgi:hypothetical protein
MVVLAGWVNNTRLLKKILLSVYLSLENVFFYKDQENISAEPYTSIQHFRINEYRSQELAVTVAMCFFRDRKSC